MLPFSAPRSVDCRPARSRALLFVAWASFTPSAAFAMMPLPAEIQTGTDRLELTTHWTLSVTDKDSRLTSALDRTLVQITARTGLAFPRPENSKAENATLSVACEQPGDAIPQLGEDESYSLTVDANHAELRAARAVGALRGLATLQQLVQSDGNHWFIPAVTIHDRPRFLWRGLMIDVCRHWQPLEVIKRNLDGMALVKLNVLHLHLTEDQGFRIESKTYPRLHALGSDGHFFTQAQIKEIIAYAAARGIRVVPEFDLPGHATSWVVGYPEFASAPGPYAIERHWGVFDPVLDPTNEEVYTMLDRFLGEMAALFPDPYLHIGGDENNGKQWSANPRIQAFIKDHALTDNAGLHAYFNRRVQTILLKYGKRMIGWDEILHPDLPKESVVHSWRGAKGLAAAAKDGHPVILSNGYYIDLIQPTVEHYLNDPLPADNALSAAEQSRVLGGEATMWSEWVSPDTIDSRIWPRTAAIAERLWSPREVVDVPDMYRRLAEVNTRLDETGLLHDRNYPVMLRRFAGEKASAETLNVLRLFVDLLEPVRRYERGKWQPTITQLTPLDTLADCARPDSAASRKVSYGIDQLLFGSDSVDTSLTNSLEQQLTSWIDLGQRVAALEDLQMTASKDAEPVARALSESARLGKDALSAWATDQACAPAWMHDKLTALARLDQRGHGAVLLPFLPSFKLLVVALGEKGQRTSYSAQEWRDHVHQVALPPQPSKP